MSISSTPARAVVTNSVARLRPRMRTMSVDRRAGLTDPVGRHEAGDQDGGIGEVELPGDVVMALGADVEASTLVVVQQRGEDAGRVVARAAPPVEGAVAGDQRGGLQVTDQTVVGDGRVPVHGCPLKRVWLAGAVTGSDTQQRERALRVARHPAYRPAAGLTGLRPVRRVSRPAAPPACRPGAERTRRRSRSPRRRWPTPPPGSPASAATAARTAPPTPPAPARRPPAAAAST